jgi:hypothetical protein
VPQQNIAVRFWFQSYDGEKALEPEEAFCIPVFSVFTDREAGWRAPRRPTTLQDVMLFVEEHQGERTSLAKVDSENGGGGWKALYQVVWSLHS